MENDEETSSGKMMDHIYANGEEKQRHRSIISGEQLDCVRTLSLRLRHLPVSTPSLCKDPQLSS
ncbi:hypothetical protein BVRB_4g076110 [Beta vulgaris subsp. vulgaris]|uniref:Uncharacterized protein n=1 Tax=Beta vulgaris subsp. vulgaris TaxID=3555 RepID=A0A0J8CKI3_BETVV|nr:hypothetical protein BVRB_4g076110 [Beta vulgaris subsp. vulgaris]